MRRSSVYFKIIFFFALLLRIALLFRSNDLFYSRPFIEDAYYSLTVARSVGHGNGFTIDGTHLTNGVQPLIVLLYAPFFSFFNDSIALRFCLIIDLIIEFCLAYLCFLFVQRSAQGRPENQRSRMAGYIAAIILLWSYSSSVYTLNGLETALSTLFVLFNVLLYQKWFVNTSYRTSYRNVFLFGISLGFMVLSRIDTGFLAPVIIAHYLFSTRKFPSPIIHIRNTIVIGVTSALVSGPWWLYNIIHFRNIIPSSGISQSLVISSDVNLMALVHLLINTLLLFGYLPWEQKLMNLHLAVLGLYLGALMIIWFVRPLHHHATSIYLHLKRYWVWKYFNMLIVYILLLLLYYIFAFGAPQFLSRYLFIAHVGAVCFAAILFSEGYHILSKIYPRFVRIVVAGSGLSLVFVYAMIYSWNFRPSIAQRQNDFYQISKWISTHTQLSDKVGMGQSGTTGFFNANVTNLDGKVNFEVMNALRKNEFCSYIRSKQFEYLIDWKKFFIDLSYCNILPDYRCIDSVGRFYIYKRTDNSALAPR